jgi:hypothetical protein
MSVLLLLEGPEALNRNLSFPHLFLGFFFVFAVSLDVGGGETGSWVFGVGFESTWKEVVA